MSMQKQMILTVVTITLLLVGCGGSGGSGSVSPPVGSNDPEVRFGGTDQETTFTGLRSLIPLADGVRLAWTRVTTEVVKLGQKTLEPVVGIQYRVFLANLPDQFNLQSPAMVVQDSDTCEIKGLPVGVVQWALVQAWQGNTQVVPDGHALSFKPAPVRYLLPGNTAALRDGLTPQTAFADLTEALARTPMPGSIWIGPGELSGGKLIPAGISLIGGFPASFNELEWDPVKHQTRFSGNVGSNALLAVGGRGYNTFSGLFLDGQSGAGVGISATETQLAVRNTTVFGVAGTGIVLLGDAPGESRISADLAHIRVIGNQGRGMELTGLTSARVWSCLFRRNLSQGIAARDLCVNPGGELLFSLRKCEISANGGVGVELGLESGTGTISGGKAGMVTIETAGCLVRDNQQEGIRVRTSQLPGIPVIGGLSVHGCDIIANGASGILFQPSIDVPGLVEGNRISANRGPAGITLSGGGGMIRVCNNAVIGNCEDGIRILEKEKDRLVMVHNNDVGANGGTGLEAMALDVAALSNNLVWNDVDAELTWHGFSLCGSGTSGPGVVNGNPQYRIFPVGFQFTEAPGTGGLVQVAWSAITAPGEFIEIADDGIARQVTKVNGTGIFFSPPLASSLPLGTAVYVLTNAENVVEDFRPGSGSNSTGKGSTYLLNPGATTGHTGITGGPLAVTRAGLGGPLPKVPVVECIFTFSPPAGSQANEIDRFTVVSNRPLDPATINTSNIKLLKASSMGSVAIKLNLFGGNQDRFVVSGFGKLDENLLLVVDDAVKAADGTPLRAPVFAFYAKDK